MVPGGSIPGTTPGVDDEFESLPGAATRVPADPVGVHSKYAVGDVNYSSVAPDVGQESAGLDDLIEDVGADMAASQVPVEELPPLIRREPNASPPEIIARGTRCGPSLLVPAKPWRQPPTLLRCVFLFRSRSSSFLLACIIWN